jgi:hypothetical protein
MPICAGNASTRRLDTPTASLLPPGWLPCRACGAPVVQTAAQVRPDGGHVLVTVHSDGPIALPGALGRVSSLSVAVEAAEPARGIRGVGIVAERAVGQTRFDGRHQLHTLPAAPTTHRAERNLARLKRVSEEPVPA